MPPKRKRLFTPLKYKGRTPPSKNGIDVASKGKEEVVTARGRLKGALMDVLDPTFEESDVSSEQSPTKRDRRTSLENRREFESDEERLRKQHSPKRQSYVLKLFDRSVDLSQFNEDSPLYPICRAWIANQPKANYSEFRKTHEELQLNEEEVELPGPEGPSLSRIPELLPEQRAANKDNINLNYQEAPPPSREQLLQRHAARWTAVRQAWLEQATKVEARYEATQDILNKINAEYLSMR